MIKSHVLYRLSYALTLCLGMMFSENRYLLRIMGGAGFLRITLRPALCRGQGVGGQ